MSKASLSGDHWEALPSRTSVGARPPRPRSQSPGLLGMFGLAQPTLEISFPQDAFFLHPNASGLPTHDEFIVGTVRLWLPKPRTLQDLSVTLLGQYDIGWPDGWAFESGTILERTVTLVQGDEGMKLEKGEHVFEFTLVLPDNSACYTRCRYGRIRHSITAKAKGLSMTGGDLVSNEKPVFCIANPGLQEPSRPPPPLYLKFEGSQEDLGPYTLALQSQHIMVGGLLLFRLSLLFPPVDVLIFDIRVKIFQHFTLRSPLADHHTCTPSPSPQTIFILDSTHPPNNAKVQDEGRGSRSGSQTPRNGPLKALRKDEMWNVVHLARLPSDNHIRPSTAEGTNSPITIHHSLQCEITYRPMTEGESQPPGSFSEKGKERGRNEKEPEPEMKRVILSKPFDMFSCCCFLDSLTLPVYSEIDTSTSQSDPDAPRVPCLCLMSLERLIKTQATSLLVDGDTPLQVEYVAPPKPEGWVPSPSASSPSTERPPVSWQDLSDTPPITPITEQDRGRSTRRGP